MAGQVVLSCAAASGSRTAATRVHGKTRPSPIYARAGRAVYRCYLLALSETCQTPIYGLASRVTLRGSKWKPHCGRVARAKRCVSGHCPPCAKRRGSGTAATERLDRLQFMAGQVGLHGDDLNACQRPDSKRPQALKSRVACAKRRGNRTAVLGA